MALTKEKKQAVVEEISQLIDSSKLTVIANYKGTTVKSIQELRKQARENDTKIKIVKNRLVIKAIENSERFKNINTSLLNGQLMYVFNSNDEVAPAQTLANFAKTSPTIEFVGAITETGEILPADEVKALASLPSKAQLRGQLVGMLSAPLSGFSVVLSANIRGVLNVLIARAEDL